MFELFNKILSNQKKNKKEKKKNIIYENLEDSTMKKYTVVS